MTPDVNGNKENRVPTKWLWGKNIRVGDVRLSHPHYVMLDYVRIPCFSTLLSHPFKYCQSDHMNTI